MLSANSDKLFVDEVRRHLLVDSHNVLHAWGWLGSHHASRREDMVLARSRLLEGLRLIRDVEGLEVTVVFDGRNPVSQADRAAAADGFVVIDAAAGLTADGVIERLATGDRDPRRCLVVTGDITVRGNVLAAGGDVLAPDDLRSWIERSRERMDRTVRLRRATQNQSYGNRLPL